MKARGYFVVRHGASEQAFELRGIPDAKLQPGNEEVLIEVEASGLNFADVLARQGLYQEAPPLPSLLGYEVVGHIAQVGAGVPIGAGLTVGQRVLAFTRFGGYASHAVAKAVACVPLPDTLDAAEATALATQGCTAWYAAEEMVRLRPGDHVLVQAAAGGVGSLLIQIAKRRGCVVYGTAGSEEKLERLRQAGVDFPINYNKTAFDQEIARLKKDGRSPGLDVIFDSLGGDAVKKGMALLRAGGRMVCFGAAQMSGDRKNPIRMLKTAAGFGFVHPIPLMMSSRALIGVNMLRVADERPEVLNRCLREVVSARVRGELLPWPVRVFPAAEIAKAHDLLGGRGSSGKVALIWER